MLLRGVMCGSAIQSGTAQLDSMVKLSEGFRCLLYQWLSSPCLDNWSGRPRSGRHVVVVVQRGPLLLVAVSSGGEPTSALRRRLDLLHGQVSVPRAHSVILA